MGASARGHPGAGVREYVDIEEDDILLRFAIILNGVIGDIDANDLRNLVIKKEEMIRGR